MSQFRKQEQAALEAVARHFFATWEQGEGPSHAYLIVAGKRIAVEVAAIKEGIAGRARKPRLRFDRVALRLIASLQAALRESVPEGKTVILTVTAPIRLPAKTAAAVQDEVRNLLARRTARAGLKDTINGNQVQARIVSTGRVRAARVIGFVHNPESDPEVLFALTHSLLESIGMKAGKRTSRRLTGERWLVIASAHGAALTETYRQVYSQLSITSHFKKVLILLAGGQVESLAG
jgi:hypothetical protein